MQAAERYQRQLSIDPSQPEALTGMALVALASGQNQEARTMAQAAVAAAPEKIAARIALGQAWNAAKMPDEAEHAYREALCLDGMDPLAHVGLGELYLAQSRIEEAEKEFTTALKRTPTLASALMGLGNALAIQKRNQEALGLYEQLLAIHPRLAEGEFAAGYVLARMKRYVEAERHYRRALAARPDFAAAWLNLGLLLRDVGREVFAQAAMERAAELCPKMISSWVNLAVLAREQHRWEDAEHCLRKAFALNPDQVETLVAWCQLRSSVRDMAGAWRWLEWALDRNPNNPEAANMHGILLHGEGRYREALEAFEQAEALGHNTAASNRGNALLDMGQFDAALEAQRGACEAEPDNAGTRYNLALTRLRQGDWEHGWADYEARWKFREVHRSPRVFEQPRWQGEQLDGKRILLHAEQGLGDTIQFCRYSTLVAARGGEIVLEVQEPVERLMNSLGVVHAGVAQVISIGSVRPEFDIECPLMSLPAVFGTTQETAPWSGAYLGALPELVRQKRELLPTVRPEHGALRVGLAWAGNPRYKADRARSTKLKTLLPLLYTPDITWVSLQKGVAAGELQELPGNLFVWDGCSADRDLAETAAVVATLDLVITTDTSIAHLAGAMGKPVWILLPYLSDWRWMQGVEESPWYPTAWLVRQQSRGDWAGVIERVRESLRRFPRMVQGYELAPEEYAESLLA